MHFVSLQSFLKKLTYLPRVDGQVTVFGAMLGSTANTCTASVYIGLDFTAFLRAGLGGRVHRDTATIIRCIRDDASPETCH